MLDLDSYSLRTPHQLPDHHNLVAPLDTARTTPMADVTNTNTDNSNSRRQPPTGLYHNPANDEFHLSIPAYLTQHGKSLKQMDQAALKECLTPVMDSLRDLNAESLLNLERIEGSNGDGARLRDGVNVRPIHDEVFPKYDCFGPNSGFSCVRYIHISEVPEQYSIGIFVFPPFARIPLHDHPEMCVLSRLLYGDLQCLSLDLPPDHDQDSNNINNPNNNKMDPQHQQQHPNIFNSFPQVPRTTTKPPQQLPPGLPEGSRRAFKNQVKHLHAPDVSLLFPYKGNLHEFFAGPNGAAVLDILLPPYDCEHERDCTFYDVQEDTGAVRSTAAASNSAAQARMRMEEEPSPNPQQPSPMMVDDDDEDDGATTDSQGRTPCWIVPTGQPHDFHCLSGKYSKLGANVLAMQD